MPGVSAELLRQSRAAVILRRRFSAEFRKSTTVYSLGGLELLLLTTVADRIRQISRSAKKPTNNHCKEAANSPIVAVAKRTHEAVEIGELSRAMGYVIIEVINKAGRSRTIRALSKTDS